MNLSKIIPFLEDGGPKKLTKRNPPNSNLNDLPYSFFKELVPVPIKESMVL